MHTAQRCRVVASRLLVAVLAVAMVFTMMPLSGGSVARAAETSLTVQTPAVVVTGQGLLGGAAYSSANISLERSYSLDELKSMQDVTDRLYSAKKNSPYTKLYFRANGVSISRLLGDPETVSDTVAIEAQDGRTHTFRESADYINDGMYTDKPGLFSGRYYYEGFDPQKKEEVPAILSWANSESGNDPNPPNQLPGPVEDKSIVRLVVGQYDAEDGGPEDRNYPLYNGKESTGASVNRICVGEEMDETVLTVGSDAYTRSDVLLMGFAEKSYTYSSSGGEKTVLARGVPMSVLLEGYNDTDVVTLAAADGKDPSVSGEITVGELIENNYMLAYETINASTGERTGIYSVDSNNGSVYGVFTLYGDGAKPAKMINQISVTSAAGIDFSKSPYKHITNGGMGGTGGPYNIDAITAATMTVEGPGLKKSVPESIRDLEGKDAGAVRADYTDRREGSNITRTYEGIDLYYILHNMSVGDNGIQLTETAKNVMIKNRNRRTIATFTLDQIEEAHQTDKPIIVAYGTGLTDGSKISPFVFDNAEGADKSLGNEDGCIKLVYDKTQITGDANPEYLTFTNMAYIYVTEEETPGYMHDKAPYDSAEMKNYVLTISGEKIGREVNYTVDQLEKMVAAEYDSDGKPDNNGMGYRDEYSLANNNYWYVNEYEGVQLWKLLLRSGLDPALNTDDTTIVKSTATDGFTSTDKFTIKQVADPDCFGFYEKNPLDNNDGEYTGNENLREGNDVTTGDKLRMGYPVLVAYGVNGYPYVEKPTQAGYLSGLENDGGPLRVISGKMYYGHPNGSSQAKFLDKILVGDDTYHYSTHKYHSEEAYTALKDNELQVRVLNGAEENPGVLTEETYTVGDIEDLIYGGELTKTQLESAKVKAAYGVTKNGQTYSDLYEGISLPYFLTDVVELPGYRGTITFSNGSESVNMDLETVLKTTGTNADTGIDGLVPVIAYGKNGAPMVATGESDGYEGKVTLAQGTAYENKITVKNSGGPLQLTFPQMDNEALSEKTISGINSITVNLSPDKYAHTEAPYDTYRDDTITIFGDGTKLTEPKDYTVSQLEGKQKLAFTGDYSFLRSGEGETASQARYRGINLYSLLTSTAVGLKTNADKVIITTTDNKSVELTLSEVRRTYRNTLTDADDLPVLLAYGSGKVGDSDEEDGLPLVTDSSSAGYDSAYQNTGGPIRLVVGQKDAEDVNSDYNKEFIKSIEVTASEIDSWNHNSSEVYKQYLTETVNLTVVDKNNTELFNKDYTVEEIENNTDLIERIEAHLSDTNVWEGIDFWKFVTRETAGIEGLEDPIKIEIRANDGVSRDLRTELGMDQLNNGIKDGTDYRPVLLAYAVEGLPLTTGNPKSQATFPNGEGYVDAVGNNGGPIRLVAHGKTSPSLSCLQSIKITVGETDTPVEEAAFTIHGLKDGDIKLSMEDIKGMKNAAGDVVGAAEGEYVRKGVTKKVKGVLLKNVLEKYGVVQEDAVITLNTPDGFENKPDNANAATYNDITLKQAVEQQYFLAYQEWNAEEETWKDINDTVKGMDITTNLRMYRYYCEANGLNNGTEWLDQCDNVTAITVDVPESTVFKEYATGNVRSTWMDGDGTLWVGTSGGSLYYKKAGENEFSVLNTESEPALMANSSSAVAADANGGIWVSQNVSYMQPNENQGVLYIQGGNVRQYKVETDPGTIPNNYVQAIKVGADGKVWFGSFGGLTIYDPQANTWKTYNKANSDFPATSVNTITLDADGGAWLGFYPDGTGTEADPYTGGFCHIDENGTVTQKNVAIGEMTQDGTTSKLAQAWVRSIAIDKKGTVWVVASGTNLTENEGGTIWKIKNGTGEPQKYTGDALFPDYLDGSATTEVRIVAVDPDGSLWFGTSADGILKVDDPRLADGKMTVAAQYAKETGSWSADNRNNVYSIDFWNNGTAYVGTSGGLQVLGDEPEAIDQKPVKGDANAESCDIAITGSALAADGYYTIRGLKNAEGLTKTNATFTWIDSAGTAGETIVEGETIENIADKVIGLADGMKIDSVTAVDSDGNQAIYTADQITRADLNGNKAMLIWKADGGNCDLTVALGQFAETDRNKGLWASNIVKLIIEGAEEETPVEPAGDATAETAALTITGDALARDGYYSMRGIKNDETVEKVTRSFNWRDDSGQTGSISVEGVTLESLIQNTIGLKKNAEIDTIEVIDSNDQSKFFTADQILTEDLQGNKAMFIWSEGTAKVQKVIIGQMAENEANRSLWAEDAIRIIVHAKAPIDESAIAQVIEMVNLLNDEVTLDSAEAIEAARAAYEALTDAEKAKVPGEVMDKLETAEQELDAVITEAYVEKVNEIAAEIDYSLYDTTDKLNLWLAADRFKQEIAKAANAAEAKAIYDEFRTRLANTLTADQKLIAKLNMGELNAKATPASYNTINLSWEGVAGAEVYEIARSESADGEYETVKTTAQESYKDTVQVTGKTYYYKIRAIAYTGENVKVAGAFCEPLEVKTSMAKPAIKNVKAGKKKATITWKKVGGAQGYELYRSTKKNGKYVRVKVINKASTVKTVNTKLKKGKTYYYKIKAFNKVDGQKVYTEFSKVKKVKIKK